MNFAGIRLLKQLKAGQQHKLLTLAQQNAFRTASSSLFSTTSKRVHQSSEKEFQLRHQHQQSKSSNSNWLAYRVASVGLLGGLAASCAMPGNMLVDFATVTLLVHHNHFGMKSVIADYAPLFLKPWIVQILVMTWLLVSIVTLALLYNFNLNNIGFSRALVKFFTL